MDDEKILNYINGELPSEEKAAFEKLLSTDESLAKRVASYREMKSFASSKISETDALIAAQNVHQTYKQKLSDTQQAAPKTNSIFKYLIPISIAAMVVLGIFVTQNLPGSDENLYAEYFNPEEIGLTNRSDNDQELINHAERQFNQKDFNGAESNFAKLIDKHPKMEIYKLYHAISQLANEKIAQSRNTLESLTENDLYKNECLYYLALSYIKTQNNSEAMKMLKQITDTSLHYNSAQELIQKLN